jgi:hypothetical protein
MRRIEWLRDTAVPRPVAAVLDAMRFDAPGEIGTVDSDWDPAVYYLNRNQLTLLARHVCGSGLPEHVRDLFDRFYQANCARLVRLRAATQEVIVELERAEIESVLLKGFARARDFVPDPDARMHYDIDLYCPDAAPRAQAVLAGIGFELIAGAGSDAACHLPPLARPTSWKWRGDFFDLETPVHVELHDRLWAPEIECFGFPGLEDFWTRREKAQYCTLCCHDSLAHRCLHLLSHLLRGDIRAAGVYEIAYFLHQNRCADRFWQDWRELHPDELRRGQAVCFALAQRWFGCEMHAQPMQCVDALSPAVREWMQRSAASPVESFFTPAKHELGLHFALLHSTGAKFRVALRRLVPMRHTAKMWEDPAAYLKRLGSRAVYHARALAPTIARLPIIRR